MYLRLISHHNPVVFDYGVSRGMYAESTAGCDATHTVRVIDSALNTPCSALKVRLASPGAISISAHQRLSHLRKLDLLPTLATNAVIPDCATKWVVRIN